MTVDLTLREFSERVGACYETVRRLAVAGKLRAYRVGRVWRIAPEEAARFRRCGEEEDAHAAP